MTCEKKILNMPAFAPDANCPVDRAEVLSANCAENSCGRCVFCREASLQLREILSDVVYGKGKEDDILILSELCQIMASISSCEMARGTAVGCLDLINGYPDQFEQHITKKRCQNLVCKQMYTLHVLPAECTGCSDCLGVCEYGAISGGSGLIHVIDNELCKRCLVCMAKCGAKAIQKAGAVKPKCPEQSIEVGTFDDTAGRKRKRRGF